MLNLTEYAWKNKGTIYMIGILVQFLGFRNSVKLPSGIGGFYINNDVSQPQEQKENTIDCRPFLMLQGQYFKENRILQIVDQYV